NLWKILKADPEAKIVVNAGYAHIQKAGQFLGAESMAEHFMKDSGITPLSVEQTTLMPHQDRGMNHPDYDPIVENLHPTQPIVFIDKAAKPWSLRPGYEVSVIFPQEHFAYDRPTWLELWGARMPFTVSGNVCQRHWPCLVAARYADEGEDAIPADRMVLDPVPLTVINDIKITNGDYSIPIGQLYLRPGQRYRLTISDERGARIGSETITVRPPGESLTNAPQEPLDSRACNVAMAGQMAALAVPCQNRSTKVPQPIPRLARSAHTRTHGASANCCFCPASVRARPAATRFPATSSIRAARWLPTTSRRKRIRYSRTCVRYSRPRARTGKTSSTSRYSSPTWRLISTLTTPSGRNIFLIQPPRPAAPRLASPRCRRRTRSN